MLLERTEKGRLELRPGVRTLPQKYRGVLLLAEGKALAELAPMFAGEGERIALDLLRQGYLEAAAPPRPPATQPARQAGADGRGEPRSLAGTRMYLFDVCERMFSRRDPALAARFRAALLGARDRESMLAAGDEMLLEIGRSAGPERAESVSARIAMLLPPATAES